MISFLYRIPAIKLSLEWIIQNNTANSLIQNRSVAIFTDSLSSVQWLESKKSKTRPDLVNEIFILKQKISNPISVIWIPSHVDIKGNEIADKLAKTALTNQNININVKLGMNELNEDINQHILELWQAEWSKSRKGSHNRFIAPKVSNKSKFNEQKSRAKEVLISRLRLGKAV